MKSIKEFERRAAESILARDAAARARNDARQALDELDGVPAPGPDAAAFYAVPEHAVTGRGYGRGGRFADDGDYVGGPAAGAPAAPDRTSQLINHGRSSAYRPGLIRRHKVAFGVAATAVVLIIVPGGAPAQRGSLLAGQCGQDAGRDHHGVPEPRRDLRAGTGQLRVRQGHAAGSLGVRTAGQLG